MTEDLGKLIAHIEKKAASMVVDVTLVSGELVVIAKRGSIVKLLQFLRDDDACQFQMFVDVSGVDYPSRLERFDVCYHLLSLTHNRRIRVKVATDAAHAVPSVASIFPGAAWYEREIYDLYGVLFSDHPDLRRILTDYGFDGHPLRKDFPLTGFVEVRYDPEQQRVAYEPVNLTQEFRNFDFLSPWEGAHYSAPPQPAATSPDKGKAA